MYFILMEKVFKFINYIRRSIYCTRYIKVSHINDQHISYWCITESCDIHSFHSFGIFRVIAFFFYELFSKAIFTYFVNTVNYLDYYDLGFIDFFHFMYMYLLLFTICPNNPTSNSLMLPLPKHVFELVHCPDAKWFFFSCNSCLDYKQFFHLVDQKFVI